MLWAGLLTCIPLACLPNSITNQWPMIGGVLRMLTAAGTVRVFHPIPFSFFLLEETYSGPNVIQSMLYIHVYLNARHESCIDSHLTMPRHSGFRSNVRQRFALCRTTSLLVRAQPSANKRNRHGCKIDSGSTQTTR